MTDNPVAVTWSDGRPPGFFGPAHGKLETDVTIPLSSHVALIGRFEATATTLALNAQGVGSFNAKTIGYSQRFIGVCSDSFLFHNMDLDLARDKEVVAQIERKLRRRRNSNSGSGPPTATRGGTSSAFAPVLSGDVVAVAEHDWACATPPPTPGNRLVRRDSRRRT